MKQDLDRLMADRDISALWVSGAANHNPAMVYFTGIANITKADLIRKRGEEPVLFHYPMEREEAARTGLRCRNMNDFNLEEILREVGGDAARAAAVRTGRIFRELGVGGRVAVYGRIELSMVEAILTDLPRQGPDVLIVGEGERTVLGQARSTKGADELSRIRAVGRISTRVLDDTADYLSACAVRRNCLVKRDGMPLTTGDVKAFVRRKLAERGGEAPEGMIFASGREAGIPHSSGTESEPVMLGRPIVFDLFPCEAGGGYFYDITRTWCLGHAPEAVEELHAQVLRAYDQAVAKIRPGIPARDIQLHVCRFFEEGGHPTIRSDPRTERGYVHTVGHGLGLDVHEGPSFSQVESNADLLRPGNVFTVEPGLYYPDRSMGVRLENTLWLSSEGVAEVLAPYPMDLILPVRIHPRSRTRTGGKAPLRRTQQRGHPQPPRRGVDPRGGRKKP
jgi:Xaa-Pro aminopeptidase